MKNLKVIAWSTWIIVILAILLSYGCATTKEVLIPVTAECPKVEIPVMEELPIYSITDTTPFGEVAVAYKTTILILIKQIKMLEELIK